MLHSPSNSQKALFTFTTLQKKLFIICLFIFMVILISITEYTYVHSPLIWKKTTPTSLSAQITDTTQTVLSDQQCENLKNEIKQGFSDANHCNASTDCIVSLGLHVSPIGCSALVNKNADLSTVKKASTHYNKSCMRTAYECPSIPNSQDISCINNKCMDIRTIYVSVTVEELKQNPKNWHNKKIVVDGIYRDGFEDQSFDSTISKEYVIWIKEQAHIIRENFPAEFGLGDTAKVTIYGVFHTGDAQRKGNFGHLGLWLHEIETDKIGFYEFISADKASCDKLGGKWGQWSDLGGEQCNRPTTDGGRICTDKSECRSVCVTTDSTPAGQTIIGTCYNWLIPPICSNMVVDGKAQGVICE